MRQSSSTADAPLDSLFGNPAVDAAVSDEAWVQAMLDTEAALALAEADAGVIPGTAASEIAAACRVESFDIASVARRSIPAGNPAAPLAHDLAGSVSPASREYVHLGATSQDIIDTAMSLIAKRAIDSILADLDAITDACSALTAAHGATLMTARTLLQPALPTTFGLKAATWLVGAGEARRLLARVRFERLAVQLGGAAGTLASLQPDGVDITHRFAARLGLVEPTVPWHTERTRIAELAAALGTVSGVLGKMARDLILLAQAEVAEVHEGEGPEHGTSSTLPQKRNQVRAVLVIAAAEQAPGLVATAFHAMVQEHERAAGAWHAEWETLRRLLHLAGGAAHHSAALLSTLRVDTARMAANLAADGGSIMAESVARRLSARMGRAAARELVRRCGDEAAERNVSFSAVVAADPEVRRHLSAAEVTAALDPAGYLGSTDELIRRALESHRAAATRE